MMLLDDTRLSFDGGCCSHNPCLVCPGFESGRTSCWQVPPQNRSQQVRKIHATDAEMLFSARSLIKTIGQLENRASVQTLKQVVRKRLPGSIVSAPLLKTRGREAYSSSLKNSDVVGKLLF